ncbi:MAG: hypothetical protein ACLSAP_05515 [Oscillospiraceae bacterium]
MKKGPVTKDVSRVHKPDVRLIFGRGLWILIVKPAAAPSRGGLHVRNGCKIRHTPPPNPLQIAIFIIANATKNVNHPQKSVTALQRETDNIYTFLSSKGPKC